MEITQLIFLFIAAVGICMLAFIINSVMASNTASDIQHLKDITDIMRDEVNGTEQDIAKLKLTVDLLQRANEDSERKDNDMREKVQNAINEMRDSILLEKQNFSIDEYVSDEAEYLSDIDNIDVAVNYNRDSDGKVLSAQISIAYKS